MKKLSTDFGFCDTSGSIPHIVKGMQREPTPTTLVSADPRLINLAQASAAAVGAPLSVVSDPASIGTVWRTPSPLLIGSDQIREIVARALPPRDHVYLVGQADSYEDLCRWSAPLGALVIQLPDGNKWLSRVIMGRAAGTDSGTVVALVSGSGGTGASTLCVGLALAAVRDSRSVALVDCDAMGGGIDLILGAENTPGWRWDKLRNAVGQIADITPMLPTVEGITVVSMERSDPVPIPGDALEAVVDCLARTHDLVLVDRGRGEAQPTGIRRTVVVTNQTVRGVAATRARAKTLDTSACGLVVRKPGSVSASDAAAAVDIPLICVLPSVADLAQLADRGIPPSPSGKWKKACGEVLAWCLGEQPKRGK